MRSFSGVEKYHHAAYAYLFIGIVYTVIGAYGMPPHDYGELVKDLVFRKFPALAAYLGPEFPYGTALWGVLTIFGLLFLTLSFFIYKGYRKLVLVLCVIYLFRTLVSGRAFVLHLMGEAQVSDTIYWLFPLVGVVFYFLLRARFDLRP